MVTVGAEHAHKPVILCHEREEFRAVVLARADRLLAGALMGHLIRAFPATPSPAQPGHRAPRSIRLA